MLNILKNIIYNKYVYILYDFSNHNTIIVIYNTIQFNLNLINIIKKAIIKMQLYVVLLYKISPIFNIISSSASVIIIFPFLYSMGKMQYSNIYILYGLYTQ
uniref:Uncharacterized protein n=1 Tax=Lotharella vacuolata TaxID=74820 RepID=A0A0H5BGX4_9EUKA|nr:hypothetical protein [Lotharella vacuolata]